MKVSLNLKSLSAGDHGFKKGDRVVCKIAKDEWYIGTIARAGVKLYVDFDDGLDAVIDASDFKHVKMLAKPKKLKRALTDAEAKDLTTAKKTLKEALQKKEPAPKAPLKPAIKPTILKPIPKTIVKPIVKTPVKPSVKAPIKPAPISTPAPDVKRPDSVVTPTPEKKPLEERKYKNNWTIELQGYNKVSWRFTIKDDPTDPSFKYRASSMAGNAQEALKRAIVELNGRAATFTIHYTTPQDAVNHVIANATIDNAAEKLGALIKSLVLPPTINKPIPVPPKIPIHQPAPTPSSPDRPIVEKTAFQLYLVPDHEGKWSFALKDSPNNPKFFHTSEYSFDTPAKALDRALDVMPNKYLGSFTLVYVETLRGNAIDRKVVFPDVGPGKAFDIVQNLWNQAQRKKSEKWLLHLINDGARIGQDNWRWQVNNYDTQERNNVDFHMPENMVEEISDGHYPSAQAAFFAAIKKMQSHLFTLRIWNGTPSNYTYNFKDVDKLRALQEIERRFPLEPQDAPAPDGEKVDPNALYLRCRNDGLFAQAERGNDNDKLRYMKDIWHRANDLIFSNRLYYPKIMRFLKEQQSQSFRRRGHWTAQKRELAMSRRVFNAGQEKFLEIFVHEMCHQAVSEIDRKVDINKGHGPYWTAWMVKSGIPPSRYDMTDTEEYMDDEEKEKHKEKMDAFEKAQEYMKTLRPISNKAPLGTPAQFYSGNERGMVQGVIVGIEATQLIFINNPSGARWLTLPEQGKNRLYEIPQSEMKADYNSVEWKKAALEVRQYLDRKKLLKQAKKGQLQGLDIRRLLGM